ncbi:MAG: bifunctional riboflavin kinase/FAD synthetase [Kiloniellales bacterium]
MAIFRHTSDLPPEALDAVVVIGNFDGVHRGHQAVIEEARGLARGFDTSLAVLTFEPHPRRFFQPDAAPFQLTGFRLKAGLIEALGVDNLFVLTFNRAFSELSAEAFLSRILVDDLRVRHVVVGENFAFGHKRRGSADFLRARAEALGFGVSILKPVTGPGEAAYSSTAIRALLKSGDPVRAARSLGRYWEIEGRVQAGEKLGRQIGFPTANIAPGNSLQPARGIYAVRAGLDGKQGTAWHDGVASFGVRPTVGGGAPLLEVHLFDLEEDLYGRHMRVAFVEYLRPEWTFDGIEPMRKQMVEDSRRARVVLKREVREKPLAEGISPAVSRHES